jgi:hypothetical protein
MMCGLGGPQILQNTSSSLTSMVTFRKKHIIVNFCSLFSSFVYVILSYMHFMVHLYTKSTKKSILDLIFGHFVPEPNHFDHFTLVLSM